MLSEMLFEVSSQAHLRNEHRMCDIEHGVTLNKNRIRPRGQAVKTTPSHGVNPGSIPGEVISVQTEKCLDFLQSKCIVRLHCKIP